MTIYEEILYVEPTVMGIVGATLLHFILWLFISDWEYIGVMKMLRNYMRKTSMYSHVITDNFKDDAQLQVYGFEDEPAQVWLFNAVTVLHHGTGGALMLAGILLQQPFLFRHGMLTEVGGMDLLDSAKTLVCKLFPGRGPFPSRNVSNNSIALFVQFVHHSVGVACCMPICLYFSDDYRFQLFGLVVLGGPVLFMVPDLLVTALVSKECRWIHRVNKCWLTAGFAYQRIVYYFPAAYSIVSTTSVADVPFAAKCLISYAVAALSVFNVLMVALMLFGLAKLFTAKDKHSKDEARQFLRSASSAVGAGKIAAATAAATTITTTALQAGCSTNAQLRAVAKPVQAKKTLCQTAATVSMKLHLH